LLRRGDGGEDERDLPADRVGNRLPAALVGNVLELDAGALLQQLARFHAPILPRRKTIGACPRLIGL
jgi:hypothetical protein